MVSGERSVPVLQDLYLDLMRSALLHTLYRPMDVAPLPAHHVEAFKGSLAEAIEGGAEVNLNPVHLRETGQDNPVYAQTMAGVARLNNVRACVESVLADEVPGDLIEAGVWRGGVPIYMRAILAAHEVESRQVVLADSFQGLPPANLASYPRDASFTAEEIGRFAVSQAEVRQNFESYGLLDNQVEWVPGWFSESLTGLADRTWALIRLDGDLYESTWDCLVNLYPRLSVGGYVIIDDWVLPPCRKAVEDYHETHGIVEEIIEIDWASSYWRRTS